MSVQTPQRRLMRRHPTSESLLSPPQSALRSRILLHQGRQRPSTLRSRGFHGCGPRLEVASRWRGGPSRHSPSLCMRRATPSLRRRRAISARPAGQRGNSFFGSSFSPHRLRRRPCLTALWPVPRFDAQLRRNRSYVEYGTPARVSRPLWSQAKQASPPRKAAAADDGMGLQLDNGAHPWPDADIAVGDHDLHDQVFAVRGPGEHGWSRPSRSG